jgi:hypothetical protein
VLDVEGKIVFMNNSAKALLSERDGSAAQLFAK